MSDEKLLVELVDRNPHYSAKSLTNAVDVFETFFGKDIVQKSVTETNCYAEQFKNSGGNIFSKQSRVN